MFEKFEPLVLDEACSCGGKLHVRQSNIKAGQLVVICETKNCRLRGYGRTVPEAVKDFEVFSRSK